MKFKNKLLFIIQLFLLLWIGIFNKVFSQTQYYNCFCNNKYTDIFRYENTKIDTIIHGKLTQKFTHIIKVSNPIVGVENHFFVEYRLKKIDGTIILLNPKEKFATEHIFLSNKKFYSIDYCPIFNSGDSILIDVQQTTRKYHFYMLRKLVRGQDIGDIMPTGNYLKEMKVDKHFNLIELHFYLYNFLVICKKTTNKLKNR
jgi:hypothetical protein